jgi:hypothetical protein
MCILGWAVVVAFAAILTVLIVKQNAKVKAEMTQKLAAKAKVNV